MDICLMWFLGTGLGGFHNRTILSAAVENDFGIVGRNIYSQ
jgi:hypothetical protein